MESHINWSHLLPFDCCWASVPQCLVLQEMPIVLCVSFGHFFCVLTAVGELIAIAFSRFAVCCLHCALDLSMGHFEFSQSFPFEGKNKRFSFESKQVQKEILENRQTTSRSNNNQIFSLSLSLCLCILPLPLFDHTIEVLMKL